MTTAHPCPHCNTIGGIAKATRDALTELRQLAANLNTAEQITRHVTLTAEQRQHVLTDRERRVLAGMAEGKGNAEIGRDLDITEDTVKTRARHMFRKLHARDRAHAVARGYQLGILGAAA